MRGAAQIDNFIDPRPLYARNADEEVLAARTRAIAAPPARSRSTASPRLARE